jgi:hypothetical protein
MGLVARMNLFYRYFHSQISIYSIATAFEFEYWQAKCSCIKRAKSVAITHFKVGIPKAHFKKFSSYKSPIICLLISTFFAASKSSEPRKMRPEVKISVES